MQSAITGKRLWWWWTVGMAMQPLFQSASGWSYNTRTQRYAVKPSRMIPSAGVKWMGIVILPNTDGILAKTADGVRFFLLTNFSGDNWSRTHIHPRQDAALAAFLKEIRFES